LPRDIDVRGGRPRDSAPRADRRDDFTPPKETDMAKGQQRGNRETKKPKKDKTKVIAAAPSRKDVAWQPDFGPAKKK
jgi:hypothetical protein